MKTEPRILNVGDLVRVQSSSGAFVGVFAGMLAIIAERSKNDYSLEFYPAGSRAAWFSRTELTLIESGHYNRLVPDKNKQLFNEAWKGKLDATDLYPRKEKP